MSLDLTTAINFIYFYSFMQHSEKAVSYMEVVLFSYCLNTRYLLQVIVDLNRCIDFEYILR